MNNNDLTQAEKIKQYLPTLTAELIANFIIKNNVEPDELVWLEGKGNERINYIQKDIIKMLHTRKPILGRGGLARGKQLRCLIVKSGINTGPLRLTLTRFHY